MDIRASAGVVTLKLEGEVITPVQLKLPWSTSLLDNTSVHCMTFDKAQAAKG